MDEPDNYACSKCGCTTYSKGDVYAKGGMFALFGAEACHFTTLSCDKCGYTEFYAIKPDSGRYG